MRTNMFDKAALRMSENIQKKRGAAPPPEAPKIYKTTVLGLGPFCVEFADGEIVTTRDEGRQRAIRAAEISINTLCQVERWMETHNTKAMQDILAEVRSALAMVRDDSAL